jgi:hypothetical protein
MGRYSSFMPPTVRRSPTRLPLRPRPAALSVLPGRAVSAEFVAVRAPIDTPAIHPNLEDERVDGWLERPLGRAQTRSLPYDAVPRSGTRKERLPRGCGVSRRAG